MRKTSSELIVTSPQTKVTLQNSFIGKRCDNQCAVCEKPTHIQRRGQLNPLVILEEKNLGSPRVNIKRAAQQRRCTKAS